MQIYTCLGFKENSPCGSSGQFITRDYKTLSGFFRYCFPNIKTQFMKQNSLWKKQYNEICVYSFTNFYDDDTFSLVYRYDIAGSK